MTVIEYREVADVEEFETRASVTDDGAKVLSGYAFRYNSWSLDLGGFKERLAPSSADKTLRARNDIKALANHDSSKVLGSTKARTLEIESDSAGARDVITLPDTTYAHDLWTVVDRRDVRGQSFGMSVVADEWNADYTERVVNEFRLHEVSVATFPAYPSTSVSARSLAMFEARSGRSRDDLAAAIDALRSGEMTDEYADLLTEAIQRSRGVSDEDAAAVLEQVDELRDAEPADVPDELFVRRARLILRERAIGLL